ncbi:uncharacterized protein [Centruroides vittatus]|uniref:uncharacterized protein isoform X2 n=1 Tax=Centruroides vittatus TaxID=120091 RepID=UPI003510BC39
MDIPPPSYSQATNQHSSLGGSLTFIDFIPDIIEQGFFSSKYESFGLIERANVWLRGNPLYEVKTCESVEFKSRQVPSLEKMTYVEYGKTFTHYMRALRLWLVVRNGLEQRPPQKIGYCNLIPNVVDNPMFGSAQYEKLNQVLDRFNNSILRNIPGRIISIESQEMKQSSSGFDPDRSNWSESGEYATKFLFVIRIFFEHGEPEGEQIGIADFVPRTIYEGGLLSNPEYEPFSNVVKMASQWCAAQRCIRYCNAQSLELKVKYDGAVDTQRMSYTEHGGRNTYYVRILRVTYTKCSELNALPPPLHLNCKTIVPYQVTVGALSEEYEGLTMVKERLKRWVELTGARVLSAETAAMRLRTGGEARHGIETTFTYNRSELNERWIYVFRLYLDGYYADPPAHLMPQPPTPVYDDCCVIL